MFDATDTTNVLLGSFVAFVVLSAGLLGVLSRRHGGLAAALSLLLSDVATLLLVLCVAVADFATDTVVWLDVLASNLLESGFKSWYTFFYVSATVVSLVAIAHNLKRIKEALSSDKVRATASAAVVVQSIMAEAVAAVTDFDAPGVADLANEDDVATPAVAELARDLDAIRAELERLKRASRDSGIMLSTLCGEDLPMASAVR